MTGYRERARRGGRDGRRRDGAVRAAGEEQ